MSDRLNTNGKEYLNAGCGTVRFDNCINMDVAKSKLIDVDVVGSVLDIPFGDESFKGVIFSHVLEHLFKREHKKALMEIRRVLKKSGTLYLEVPDFNLAIEYFLKNHKGRSDYWYMCVYGREDYSSDVHKSGITEQYLTDLLFECGYGHLKWIDISKEEALLAVVATKLDDLPSEKL